MKWQITALKVLLVMICVVNLTLGVLAFTSKPLILKAINAIYGVQLTEIEEQKSLVLDKTLNPRTPWFLGYCISLSYPFLATL